MLWVAASRSSFTCTGQFGPLHNATHTTATGATNATHATATGATTVVSGPDNAGRGVAGGAGCSVVGETRPWLEPGDPFTDADLKNAVKE